MASAYFVFSIIFYFLYKPIIHTLFVPPILLRIFCTVIIRPPLTGCAYAAFAGRGSLPSVSVNDEQSLRPHGSHAAVVEVQTSFTRCVLKTSYTNRDVFPRTLPLNQPLDDFIEMAVIPFHVKA
jgi:hypothetical protein